MSRIWRVWHPPPVAPGRSLPLDREQSHHARAVLRLEVGDPLRVIDGEGGEWEARIAGTGRSGVVVEVGAALTTPGADPTFPLTLHQALCRPDRTEWVLQKACEVGVVAVRLFPAERGAAREPGERRVERWRRILIESCKQCGRRRPPNLAFDPHLPPVPDGTLGLRTDGEARRALADVVRDPRPAACALAVGPEAGWAAGEGDDGWTSVSLGPRTFRAETAGLVAAAIVLGAWGDLGI